MHHPHACHTSEHGLTRRRMMQLLGATVGTAGMGRFVEPAFAEAVRKKQKQVLFVWLDGGMSQLETWDPKPGTQFGGPFQAIQTSVPGVQISELMPGMAKRMNQFAVVRSMHTRFEDHSRAVLPIQRGDPKDRGVTYPFLGSAISKLMGGNGDLPPYIHIKPGSGGFHFRDAGFLGPQYGALALGDGKVPSHVARPNGLSSQAADSRNRLRKLANSSFEKHRVKTLPNAYNHTYRVAEQLMKHTKLFDPSRLPARDIERYGNSQFGRHLLQARTLLEAGVTFVKVTMYYWDSHGDNFNCHLSAVPRVDTALSALLDDLVDRGMYDNTLVIVLSEFGRTPKINGRIGRDHWPEAWSVGFGGCGIKRGVVVGKTNAKGSFVVNDSHDVGHLFHTFFRALGIDPTHTEYDNNGQPLPIAHDDHHPIKDVLA
ncbi:MAG: DUF1501 domain-containing protein [Planctomycetaceae bacterium]